MNVFDRFRVEQLQELIEYLEEEEKQITGEVIGHVASEQFTKASMTAGELSRVRVFRRRLERALKARREE